MLEGSSPYLAALWLMLAYCAAPGAVNVETVRRGTGGGFVAALLVQLGAVAGRVIWATLALAGTGVLTSRSIVYVVITAVSASLLLRAAWQAFRVDRAVTVVAPPVRFRRRGALAAGFLLSLTNPLALAFWSGFVSVLQLDSSEVWDAHTAPGVLITVMFGALAWSVSAAVAVTCARAVAGQTAARLAELVAGVALGLFGLQMAWESGKALLTVIGQ
jgi:threonine/homoserine/homoserine lactone efflux protein